MNGLAWPEGLYLGGEGGPTPTVERPAQRAASGSKVVREATVDPLLAVRPWAGAVRTIRSVEESLERGVRR